MMISTELEKVIMLRPFDINRTIQAAAVLLKETNQHQMSRVRLLKLLYIANRESLQSSGAMIADDRMLAMKQGPVMSRTYDLIKGKDFYTPYWDQHIQRAGEFDVRLLNDPGLGELSATDIERLQQISQTYEHAEEWELVEITHQFPEWQKNQPGVTGANPIVLDDLLEALGMSECKDDLLEAADAANAFDKLLATVP